MMLIEKEQQAINKWQSLRKRCKDKNLEFNLTVADVRRLIVAKRCYYTGVVLKRGEVQDTTCNWSIDRKDPTKGYIKGNVVASDIRVNRLKANLTKQEISRLANKM
jgi:hypothetical protein